MALFENFPWTNVHELNLDWIVKIVLEMKDSLALISSLEEQFNALKDYVDNYFESTEVKEEIKTQVDNYLNDLMETGQFAAIISKYVSGGVTERVNAYPFWSYTLDGYYGIQSFVFTPANIMLFAVAGSEDEYHKVILLDLEGNLIEEKPISIIGHSNSAFYEDGFVFLCGKGTTYYKFDTSGNLIDTIESPYPIVNIAGENGSRIYCEWVDDTHVTLHFNTDFQKTVEFTGTLQGMTMHNNKIYLCTSNTSGGAIYEYNSAFTLLNTYTLSPFVHEIENIQFTNGKCVILDNYGSALKSFFQYANIGSVLDPQLVEEYAPTRTLYIDTNRTGFYDGSSTKPINDLAGLTSIIYNQNIYSRTRQITLDIQNDMVLDTNLALWNCSAKLIINGNNKQITTNGHEINILNCNAVTIQYLNITGTDSINIEGVPNLLLQNITTNETINLNNCTGTALTCSNSTTALFSSTNSRLTMYNCTGQISGTYGSVYNNANANKLTALATGAVMSTPVYIHYAQVSVSSGSPADVSYPSIPSTSVFFTLAPLTSSPGTKVVANFAGNNILRVYTDNATAISVRVAIFYIPNYKG